MTPELTTYFNQLKQDILTIASESSSNSSQVIAVDMIYWQMMFTTMKLVLILLPVNIIQYLKMYWKNKYITKFNLTQICKDRQIENSAIAK